MATAERSESSTCTAVFAEVIQALAAITDLNLNSLVNGTLLGLKNTIDELTQNVTTYPDPQVEFEIENLRQKLVELKILLTRRFIPGCKSVARFATRSGQLQRIRADLEAGRVEKLCEFLNTLKKHINTCQERAKTFKSEFDELKEKVEKAMGTHGKEQKRLKERGRSTEALSNVAKVAGGAVVVAGVATGAGLVASASVSVAYLVFSGSLLGGMAAAGTARGLSIVHKFTKEDYDLIQSVTKHINDLNVELGGLNEKFKTVSSVLDSAKESLDDDGISDKNSIQANDVDSIMPALKDFSEDMTGLLTACEET